MELQTSFSYHPFRLGRVLFQIVLFHHVLFLFFHLDAKVICSGTILGRVFCQKPMNLEFCRAYIIFAIGKYVLSFEQIFTYQPNFITQQIFLCEDIFKHSIYLA